MPKHADSILVVDDDPQVLAALAAELEDHYEITAVSSAEQALAILQCRAFSAIISDVRMPGVDGLSLLGQCAVRYPDMVRVILTAFDGEDVQTAALGPHGAYKLVKPWGDDLLITLSSALKQRESAVELRRHLDLSSGLLDVDRRLHPDLEEGELMLQTAMEIAQLPEVAAAVLYKLDEDGEITRSLEVKSSTDMPAPQLKRPRSGPIAVDGGFLYAVPIGGWTHPVWAVAVHLSRVAADTVKYLEFVARQAHRTLTLKRAAEGTPLRPLLSSAPRSIDRDSDPALVAITVLQELTTPATVLGSAVDSLPQIAAELERHGASGEEFSAALNELGELTADLTTVSSSILSILERLKVLSQPAE